MRMLINSSIFMVRVVLAREVTAAFVCSLACQWNDK